MNDDEEIIQYIEKNWKNFARIAVLNLYPEDLEVKQTSISETIHTYVCLQPPSKGDDVVEHLRNMLGGSAVEYFNEHYKELKYINVYNGYKPSELVEYLELPAKIK